MCRITLLYNCRKSKLKEKSDFKFTPISLTERRKAWLENRFRISWNNHISANCQNGFDCNLQEEDFWPHEE